MVDTLKSIIGKRDVPIELMGVQETQQFKPHTDVNIWATSFSANTSTYNVYTNLFSYTGSGALEFIVIINDLNPSLLDIDARLVIDGTVVWEALAGWVGLDTSNGMVVIGANAAISSSEATGTSFGNVPFNTSFALEFRKAENAAGQIDMSARLRWRKES